MNHLRFLPVFPRLFNLLYFLFLDFLELDIRFLCFSSHLSLFNFLLFHKLLYLNVSIACIPVRLRDLNRKLFYLCSQVHYSTWFVDIMVFTQNQTLLWILNWKTFHMSSVVFLILKPMHFFTNARISSFQEILLKTIWITSTFLL